MMSRRAQQQSTAPAVARAALPWWQQLRWRLALSFVLLVVLPIAAIMVLSFTQVRQTAEDQAINQLQSVSELKAQEIDRWLQSGQESIRVLLAGQSRRNQFIDLALSETPELEVAATSAITAMLSESQAEVAGVTEYFFYEPREGRVLISSDPDRAGQVVRAKPYFEPSKTGPFIQSPYYEVTNELNMVITEPLALSDGTLVGVLAAQLDLETLSNIMLERAGLGDTGETYLVSAESNFLLTASRFEGYQQTRAYRSEGIDRALGGASGSGLYTSYRDVPVFGVYRWLPTMQAALVSEIAENEALADYFQVRQLAVLLTALLAAVAAGLGVWVATRFTNPLNTLAGVATRLAQGDLSQRATLRERSEIGLLASTFNDMADQLQGVVGSLEERVQARTRDLFLTLEVGQLASRMYRLDELLPGVTEYIRERFDLYYTQVYINDDANRYTVLVSGTGEVGQELLSRRHRLDLGATSIVARSVQTRRPVLVSNTETSAVFLPNPLLPETRSEVAIPLTVGGEVIGVLDMQARQADTFREDNLPVFEAMANQLAAAIRSAEAYAETEAAIERATLVNRRLTAEAWESYLGRIAQEKRVGYRYDLQRVEPLDAPLEVTPDPLPPEGGRARQLARPVRVGEHVIGTIALAEDDEREWSGDDIELIDGVAARVALALDQYRAFDETHHLLDVTSRRAVEMQTVAEVGAEASSTLDVNQLLWTVSDLAKERFGLYHAHVYMLDQASHALVLRAGAGDAGRHMVAAGHRIALSNMRSLVARAARERETVVVDDVTTAPDFLPNPLLPRTRSEMAIPMIVGRDVIGVLDVQAEVIRRFSDEDVQVMTTLASQVAVAVNNARLFAEQVQVADRLREVDRLKSEFLASMSHELRTPLNSIIGYAEVLLDGIDGDLTADMEEDVEAIHGSGKHLLNLINDILDLAKIEAGQMDLVAEPLDLRALVEDMASATRVLLKEKPVEMVIDVPDDFPKIHGDSLRLRQILSNLMTNASKFTEEGTITVWAQVDRDDPARAHIGVSDTGIGMTPDQLNVIFDRFRQVDQSHTRRAGGTGLGLSITRQLIQMHGGDIQVRSIPGEGSTFSFTVPFALEEVGA